MSLEATMEYIQADEFVEICPISILMPQKLPMLFFWKITLKALPVFASGHRRFPVVPSILPSLL